MRAAMGQGYMRRFASDDLVRASAEPSIDRACVVFREKGAIEKTRTKNGVACGCAI